jgi:hypothetical protein
MEKATLDPLDVAQWEFFVVPTTVLDARKRSQHSITLKTLASLVKKVRFDELSDAVETAGSVSRSA